MFRNGVVCTDRQNDYRHLTVLDGAARYGAVDTSDGAFVDMRVLDVELLDDTAAEFEGYFLISPLSLLVYHRKSEGSVGIFHHYRRALLHNRPCGNLEVKTAIAH